MITTCLLPLFFVGYAHTIQTEWHHSANLSGPFAEMQTCRDGVGGRLAFSHQWVQVGPQYGYTWSLTDYLHLTTQIHGGFGYSNTHHPLSQVRQVTKWNGGVSLSMQYGVVSVKIGYDHMSNGKGADPTNSGQDLVSIGVGYTF